MADVETILDQIELWLDAAYHVSNPIADHGYVEGTKVILAEYRNGELVERALQQAIEDPGWR